MSTPLYISNPDEHGNCHALVLGHTAKGKSMLDRLSKDQLAAWNDWMAAHPGTNGMEWPGWADTLTNRPETDMGDVLKNASPLYVQLPSDASEETKAALSKLAIADLKR